MAAGITASLLWFGTGCANYPERPQAAPDYSVAALAPSIVRIRLRSDGPGSAVPSLDLTLLRTCEVAMERGDSYFAVIDEDATSTGQIVYYPGLAHAAFKPGRGLLIKFFSSKPKGIFSFQARNLHRIIDGQLNLNQ